MYEGHWVLIHPYNSSLGKIILNGKTFQDHVDSPAPSKGNSRGLSDFEVKPKGVTMFSFIEFM